MKKIALGFLIATILGSLFGCQSDSKRATMSIKNNLDLERTFETIIVKKSDLPSLSDEDFTRLQVRDANSGQVLVSQFVAEGSGANDDVILFQPVLEPKEEKEYELFVPVSHDDIPQPTRKTYSRFVPERTDDYAWENDRVAFRTYGPEAQRMIEESIQGGTLSSGMDCWLKKVDYPIINSWYRKHLDGTNSYHKDSGEGLDNFHVGKSRGCGGIGIWDPDLDLLSTSRNFTKWSTFAEGPIRTKFRLDYAPWTANMQTINEYKVISLDLGNNLSRYEIVFEGQETPGSVTAGLTLHEKDGYVATDPETGWFSYWQPHGDSELGMGIVVENKYYDSYTEHLVDEADLSHLLVHLKPINGKIIYYAGFGWKESGQFNTEEEWIQYLTEFSLRISSPLEMMIIDSK